MGLTVLSVEVANPAKPEHSEKVRISDRFRGHLFGSS